MGERIFLGALQILSWGCGALAIYGIVYTFVQLCLGNYHGTASFEF